MIIEVFEYITADGDRWDLLAWKFYGDATRYEAIIAANPEVPISAILPAGIRLLIPVIEDYEPTNTQDLPPWKQ
jgi:phage tail protein X